MTFEIVEDRDNHIQTHLKGGCVCTDTVPCLAGLFLEGELGEGDYFAGVEDIDGDTIPVDSSLCDRCGNISDDVVWIDDEFLAPQDNDNYNEEKAKQAVEKGIAALCLPCYWDVCCD